MDRPVMPPPFPPTHVSTPFAETRVTFADYDRNRDTWIDPDDGEYVRITPKGSGEASVITDSGDLFRAVARRLGLTGFAISMVDYQRFMESFDRDRSGVLDAAEMAAFRAWGAALSRSFSGPAD